MSLRNIHFKVFPAWFYIICSSCYLYRSWMDLEIMPIYWSAFSRKLIHFRNRVGLMVSLENLKTWNIFVVGRKILQKLRFLGLLRIINTIEHIVVPLIQGKKTPCPCFLSMLSNNFESCECLKFTIPNH